MSPKVLLILTFAFLIACQSTFSQNKSSQFLFLDSLLAKDKYNVELLDFEVPKEVQDIALRFQKAVAEKKEWFQEYFNKNMKPGEGLPYHENFGITKEEYERFKNIDKKKELTVVVRSTGLVKASRNAQVVTFSTAENNLKFFELLKIDLQNETVLFRNDTIPFLDEINAPAASPFGEWQGYMWQKTRSNSGESDLIVIDKLTYKSIEVDFGKVRKNNKTLLRIKYKDIDQGTAKAQFDIACYLN